MKPGRELDALVAEKIFGLDPASFNRSQSYYELMEAGLALKPYSKDIAAAWTIVEKGYVESVVRLADGRWFARHASEKYDDDNYGFARELSGFDHKHHGNNGTYYEIPIYENEDSGGAFGETAAHAICLAALKASGI